MAAKERKEHRERRGGFSAAGVAQIFNLPYRGFATCGPSDEARTTENFHGLPIANRRYGRLKICATLAALFMCAGSESRAAEKVDFTQLPPPAARAIDFDRDVQPLLERSCLRCHGPEKPKSGFRLDAREPALRGGENGVDIRPRDSTNSPLVHYIAGLVEDMQMPPKGKAEPLTPAEIGIMRAWIDQGASWGTNTPYPRLEAALAPIVGWTSVSGDRQKFREHYWMRDGWNGGVEQFSIIDKVDPNTTVTTEGRAWLDDYKVSVSLDRREVGFVHFGFEQSRKYYDDSGGYFPGFNPPIMALHRDLYLDRGRAWADFGLTLPNWPHLTLGYEYLYRDGTEATLQWGTVNGGGNARNIYPNTKSVDERVHVIKFDLDHEIAGVRIEDSFRGEFLDLGTTRRNVRDYAVGGAAPDKSEIVRENHHQFQGANAIRLEKPFKDWIFVSAGYLYSKLEADANLSLDNFFPSGNPTFGDRWRSRATVLTRESHVFNANTLLGPWNHFTLSAGVLNEWTRQEGFGRAEEDLVFPNGFVLKNPERFDANSDRMLVEESAALRYTALRYTALFAEARLRQERLGQYESEAGSQINFVNQRDVATDWQDWRVGFNTSPWRSVSFEGHYRRTEKETDYDKRIDTSGVGPGYPAFIRERGTDSDEIAGRVVVHPCNWLKTSVAYKYVRTLYHTDTDPVTEDPAKPNDISPGGTLRTADYRAHVASLNATVTPWSRLYLSGTFSYEHNRLATFDNRGDAVVPYAGDVFSVLASATFVVTTNTDWTTTYNFSCADYAQDNFTAGLPLGLRYHRNGVTTGFAHRFCANATAKVQYGFYDYAEPSSGGHNDYLAHAVFATLVWRFP